jgi:hypothetical protein
MTSRHRSWLRVTPAAVAAHRDCCAAAAVLLLLAAGGRPASAAEASARGNAKVLQLCTGKYALCDAAACRPLAQQGKVTGTAPVVRPATAVCECVVEEGQNLGPGPCENRNPRGPHGEYILSTYSFALKDDLYLSCPAGGERTVCFGYPCIIDPLHPERAYCTCPITYDSKAFMTQGGKCDAAACTHGLWQGGTPAEYALINTKFAKETGQKPPEKCPAKP